MNFEAPPQIVLINTLYEIQFLVLVVYVNSEVFENIVLFGLLDGWKVCVFH